MIRKYIFDLDGTLYPKESLLFKLIRSRTKNWIQEKVQVPNCDFDYFYKKLKKKHPHPYDGFNSLGLSIKEYHDVVFTNLDVEKLLQPSYAQVSLVPNNFNFDVVSLASLNHCQVVLDTLKLENRVDNVISMIDYFPNHQKINAYDILKGSIPSNCVLVVGDSFHIDLKDAKNAGYNTHLL